jgi:hypothetical protein
MLSLLDTFINRITMYRLVLYYLVALVVVAALYSFLGLLHFTPQARLRSPARSLLISNVACAKVSVRRQTLSRPITGIDAAHRSGRSDDVVSIGFIRCLCGGHGIEIYSPLARSTSLMRGSASRSRLYPRAVGIVVDRQTQTFCRSSSSADAVVRKTRQWELVLSFSLVIYDIDLTAPQRPSPWPYRPLSTPFFFFALVMLTSR